MYQILRDELKTAGVTAMGPRAETLVNIGSPAIDWTALARALGVEAFRAVTADEQPAKWTLASPPRVPWSLK